MLQLQRINIIFLFAILFTSWYSVGLVHGQTEIDSLKKVLINHLEKDGYSNDTTVAKTYYRLAVRYKSDKDSANFYYDLAVQLCDRKLEELKYSKEKSDYLVYLKGLSLSRIGQNHYGNSDFEKAKEKANEAANVLRKLELSENKKAREKGLNRLIRTYYWLGTMFQKQGESEEALNLYDEIERYTYITKDTAYRAAIYGNIAVLHKNKGRLKEALEFNFKSLKLAEQTQNTKRIGLTLGNIGVVYKHLKEYDKAEEYYNRAINIYEQIGYSKGLATQYNNLGVLSKNRESYDEALSYYERCLQIAEDLDKKESIISAKVNMSVVLLHQKKYEEAERLLLGAYQIAEKLEIRKSQISISLTLADLYIQTKEFERAKPYLERTLNYAEEMDSHRFKESAHQNYYSYHDALGNHEEALKHYKDYIKYRDKVYNLDSKEAALEQEMKLDYQTKKIRDSIEFAKESEVNELMIKQQESELQTQRNLQVALVVILSLILIFALFMFNRFRVTHRQKNTIELQKKVVDEKNREISDSINYAKRIQEAILPSRYIFNEVMSNGFVIFKPKDVVSGDFYWIEEAHGLTYVAAADCTGHGVPGALVSVICSNALSKVLFEEGVEDPANILDRTREIIIDKFRKSEDRVNDGMDISLCAIDKKNMKVHWAGANNPLWLIRKSSPEKTELIEIKADKQPIGVYEKQTPFTSHSIDLKYNDVLYLFSDGFPDQFGGPNEKVRKQGGKKYKSKPFKNFLMEMQDTPIKMQQEQLEKEFYDWKGNLDQVDDVCIIGIRIK